jgi:hypothetical protein
MDQSNLFAFAFLGRAWRGVRGVSVVVYAPKISMSKGTQPNAHLANTKIILFVIIMFLGPSALPDFLRWLAGLEQMSTCLMDDHEITNDTGIHVVQ